MQQEERVRSVTVTYIAKQMEVESLRLKLVSAAKRQPDQLVHIVGKEKFITIPAETDGGQGVGRHLVVRLVETPHCSVETLNPSRSCTL